MDFISPHFLSLAHLLVQVPMNSRKLGGGEKGSGVGEEKPQARLSSSRVTRSGLSCLELVLRDPRVRKQARSVVFVTFLLPRPLSVFTEQKRKHRIKIQNQEHKRYMEQLSPQRIHADSTMPWGRKP